MAIFQHRFNPVCWTVLITLLIVLYTPKVTPAQKLLSKNAILTVIQALNEMLTYREESSYSATR